MTIITFFIDIGIKKVVIINYNNIVINKQNVLNIS